MSSFQVVRVGNQRGLRSCGHTPLAKQAARSAPCSGQRLRCSALTPVSWVDDSHRRGFYKQSEYLVHRSPSLLLNTRTCLRRHLRHGVLTPRCAVRMRLALLLQLPQMHRRRLCCRTASDMASTCTAWQRGTSWSSEGWRSPTPRAVRRTLTVRQ